MKIITVPHQTLRVVAQPVTQVDKKLKELVKGLEETLSAKINPRGVGLAAPQVDRRSRVFVTQLPVDPYDDEDEATFQIRTFINPEIIDHSGNKTFGPDKKDPILEGCLSIPGFYGPVPRWEWIQVRFQTLEENELVEHVEKFDQFAARVMQHENDHLNGVLFIDYIVEFDLPLYQENKKNSKLYELEPELVLSLVESSK
jgi:peptide deformylase